MLSRLALRLCAMEALCPTAALPAGVFPTIAGKLVYDTRITPLDDINNTNPVIVLFTELDNRDPSQKAGGPPFKRLVDFVIEISVVASGPDPADPTNYVVVCPASDGEHEASLDVLEAQVAFQLFYSPQGLLFRKLTANRVTDFESLPVRSSEEGARIAMRQLRMKITFDDDVYVAAPTVAAVGLDRLSQPLRDVITALAGTAYGVDIATGLAAVAPQMPIATPLKTVTLDEDVADPQGVTDGNVDVSASADNLDT